MATEDPFELLMRANYTAAEAISLGNLMTVAEFEAPSDGEKAFDPSSYMQAEHPYIAEDTALYKVGVALQSAFHNRGDLIYEPLDPRDDIIIDGEEWELTDKRQALFRSMCSDIATDIKFNPRLEVRLEVFESNLKSTRANITDALMWQEMLPEEAKALTELASHIVELFCLDAEKHFQLVA